MIKKQIIMIAILFISSCASLPTQDELQTADYGQPMTQKECEIAAKAVLDYYLKDPMSAQLSFGRCETRGASSVPILNLPKQFGYYISVSVNAKNSFGGYIGAKEYGFLFNSGSVIRKLRQDDQLGRVMMPF